MTRFDLRASAAELVLTREALERVHAKMKEIGAAFD